MNAYLTAVEQIRTQGYVSDDVASRLSGADLARANIEASKPA